jgi:chemotaxis protein MotB
MRKKKGHGGEHENSERWLLTYADMITLLVAFFIMLYAMSVVNKVKFEALAISVRSGFDGNDKMQTMKLSPGTGILQSNALVAPTHITDFERPDGTISEWRQEAESLRLESLKSKIEAVAKARGIEKQMAVTENARGVDIRILADSLLFNTGDGRLKPNAGPLLAQIAVVLNSVTNDVCVEGHTDNLAIDTPLYPSNWELSTARATNVLRFLVERGGVSADRLSASGYADTRPVVPNTSDANRALNRRVDIVILKDSFDT